jgi:hypothetical protein
MSFIYLPSVLLIVREHIPDKDDIWIFSGITADERTEQADQADQHKAVECEF